MSTRERVLVLPTGLTIAAKLWGASELAPTLPIVCLHGWMDSAGSFDTIAPALAAVPGACVVAIDFPGHGRSGHLPATDLYDSGSYVSAVVGACDALGWERMFLCGHSMGGGVATVFAGAFPARTRGVVLLDSSGPPHRTDAEAPEAFARALLAAQRLAKGSESVYATAEDAAQARAATATTHPGSQTLSLVGARALVARALVDTSGGVRFAHDGRIKAPPPLALGEGAVATFLGRIASAGIPCLLVRAANGWPYSPELLAARSAVLAGVLETVHVPGSHHTHLDPDTAPRVASALVDWLTRTVGAE